MNETAVEERVIVSAWLPEPLGTRFENYRWRNRMTKTDVVTDAVVEYLERHDTQPAQEQAQS